MAPSPVTPPEGTTTVPDFYAEIAAELRRMADDLDTLTGLGLPKPWLTLNIQPHGDTDDEIIAGVDAVAGALLGKPGRTARLSGGAFHYDASGSRGLVRIGVYQAVSDPAARERDAELVRLRAELAAALRTADRPIIVVHDETAELYATTVAVSG
jgi:hypothetical protein